MFLQRSLEAPMPVGKVFWVYHSDSQSLKRHVSFPVPCRLLRDGAIGLNISRQPQLQHRGVQGLPPPISPDHGRRYEHFGRPERQGQDHRPALPVAHSLSGQVCALAGQGKAQELGMALRDCGSGGDLLDSTAGK